MNISVTIVTNNATNIEKLSKTLHILPVDADRTGEMTSQTENLGFVAVYIQIDSDDPSARFTPRWESEQMSSAMHCFAFCGIICHLVRSF